jgi:hypothetical protein
MTASNGFCHGAARAHVSLLVLALGCSNQSTPSGVSNPPLLRDTTGAEFAWNCDAPQTGPDGGPARTCAVGARTDTPPVPDCGTGSQYFYMDLDSFAAICVSASPPDGSLLSGHAEMCRPVACEHDMDCPQFTNGPHACVDELCRKPGATGNAEERLNVLALCLATVTRPSSCSLADADPTTERAKALVESACGFPEDGGEGEEDFFSAVTAPTCPVPATCRPL